MSKFFRFLYYWLPPITWMSLIFYLSSRQRIGTTGEFFSDFLVYKTLHMIEYAFLYLLFFRAFYSLSNRTVSFNNKFILPIVISIIYAASDEIHQTFTPHREGRIRDIFIDTAGITIMYIYIRSHINVIKKYIK